MVQIACMLYLFYFAFFPPSSDLEGAFIWAFPVLAVLGAIS